METTRHTRVRVASPMIILLAFFTSHAVFSSNQDDFDVSYYGIHLTINPADETVAGYVIATAISSTDHLQKIAFDLRQNMTVTAITGNAAGFVHENDLVSIELDRIYSKGEKFSTTIQYHGHPSSGSNFNPMTFSRARGVATISSESCPYYARCWWPCKDRPDDKPDSMDLFITVPSNLTVAANGMLVDVTDNKDGTATFHWQIRNPIATYLVCFSATDYKIIQDKFISADQDTLALMHFVFPEHFNNALTDFNTTGQMLEILESYYGKYPYYNEKYGAAEYVGYWGGMEYQTLSCLQSYLIRGDHYYDDVFVHELAHQWWGDCISPKDFHHSWISEGFATFSEALYFGHLEGQEKYRNYMTNQNSALSNKGIMYRHDISDPDVVYDLIVYYKGAWVIHMLRHVVGEGKFWQALRDFRSHFEYSSATTEDLQQVFENVTGNSLEWFFHEWVYEPNYPQYRFGWHQEKVAGQYNLYGFIEQVQTDAPLFKMPIDLTIATQTMDTTFAIMVDDTLEKFHYVSLDSIVDFQFDKDDWVLKKTEIITTPIFQYVDHQLVDSTGNNNEIADPGETVDVLLRITNTGILCREIAARLITSDPSIEAPAQTFRWLDLTTGYENLKNDLEFSLPITVKPGAASHLALLKIQFDADHDYTSLDSFYIKIGSPTILLVDDDAGANYEQYLTQSMALSKIYSDTWEVTSNGFPGFADVLQNYQIVIWFTGDDRTTSLTRDEQNSLAEFLDHGGNLVLTGQNIGYDLVTDGAPEDSLFFTNYLHADFVADTVSSTRLIGASGDPIASGMFVFIDEKVGGARNQQSPDAISPRDGAVAFLKYIPQMSAAAIRYVDGAKNYNLAYLGFGMEGISGPYQDSAQKLLEKILSWFSKPTGVENTTINSAPQKFQLEQNYPNPFNPSTTIRYHLAEPGHVQLAIYNLSGQQIRTLLDQRQLAGSYESTWDGADDNGLKVASGVYIYRIRTKSFHYSRKLALVK